MEDTVKIVKNKTLKYFAPSLKTFGDEFLYYVNSLQKKGFFLYVHDLKLIKNKLTDECIFLVFKDTNSEFIDKFIVYLEKQELLLGISTFKDFIVFCIKIPDPLKEKYYNFLKGDYSKMYTKEEFKMFFKKMDDYHIFFKKEAKNFKNYEEVVDNVTKQLENLFECNGISFEKELQEWDVPPNFKDEVLNFEGHNNLIINFDNLKNYTEKER
jgi:hypothetical protein